MKGVFFGQNSCRKHLTDESHIKVMFKVMSKMANKELQNFFF